MSGLENIKPVAFYRADWKGDMMFRKDNTVIIRKNEGDFTTGWIKPLYDELPEPQPQLTIPKSIADIAYKYRDTHHLSYSKTVWEWIQTSECKEKAEALIQAYLAGKALGVDLVKVVDIAE